MRHALYTAPKPHLLAEVVPPFPANRALPAGNAYFERYTVAECEAIHVWANANYHTGRLMAKGQWRRGAKVAVGEFLVVADIGATDACGFNLDLKLA
jgi:hypothetical protein